MKVVVVYDTQVIAEEEVDYTNAKAILDLIKEVGFNDGMDDYLYDSASFAINDLRIFIRDYERIPKRKE